MHEAIRKTRLIFGLESGTLTDGDHLGILNEFTEAVTAEFTDPEDWHYNNSELIKLESTLELYRQSYTGESKFIAIVINIAVDFLQKIRETLVKAFSAILPVGRRQIIAPFEEIVIPSEEIAEKEKAADLSTIDLVEAINGFHFRFFPHLTKNRVREKVNQLFGTNLTERQLNNNYANIKRRGGNVQATFFQNWFTRFNEHLAAESAKDDARFKTKRK